MCCCHQKTWKWLLHEHDLLLVLQDGKFRRTMSPFRKRSRMLCQNLRGCHAMSWNLWEQVALMPASTPGVRWTSKTLQTPENCSQGLIRLSFLASIILFAPLVIFLKALLAVFVEHLRCLWWCFYVQVAHFTTPTCFCDLEPLHTSLNGILPPDIRILEVSSVQPDFHARYSACRKTYQYKAYVSPVMDPFQHAYAYHIKNSVNIAAMEEAASYFVGTHNFSAFANHSADTASRDTLRDLLSFTVSSIVRTSFMDTLILNFFQAWFIHIHDRIFLMWIHIYVYI